MQQAVLPEWTLHILSAYLVELVHQSMVGDWAVILCRDCHL